MITVRINNEAVSLPEDNMTLRRLLEWRGVPEGGTAAAVNGRLVPRSKWDSVMMNPDDDVVVISAAFGG